MLIIGDQPLLAAVPPCTSCCWPITSQEISLWLGGSCTMRWILQTLYNNNNNDNNNNNRTERRNSSLFTVSSLHHELSPTISQSKRGGNWSNQRKPLTMIFRNVYFIHLHYWTKSNHMLHTAKCYVSPSAPTNGMTDIPNLAPARSKMISSAVAVSTNTAALWPGGKASASKSGRTGFFFFFFCVPQLYLWGSPFLGEIFAYVTVF